MINKITATLEEAVAKIPDGAVVGIGGFGVAGLPTDLIYAVIDSGVRDITVVSNNAGTDGTGIARLVKSGAVSRIICSYPKSNRSHDIREMFSSGKLQIECVPQGVLVDRLHAGGAGLGPFYTPTSYGTLLAEDKETREFDGKHYVLQMPIRTDFSLVAAERADRWGNLTFRKTAYNFNPVMCRAARHTIVQAAKIEELGDIDPDDIDTAGIFVDQVVHVPNKTLAL